MNKSNPHYAGSERIAVKPEDVTMVNVHAISLFVLMGRGLSVTARERQLLEIFHLKDVAHDHIEHQ